jgi:hypothetical protein
MKTRINEPTGFDVAAASFVGVGADTADPNKSVHQTSLHALLGAGVADASGATANHNPAPATAIPAVTSGRRRAAIVAAYHSKLKVFAESERIRSRAAGG